MHSKLEELIKCRDNFDYFCRKYVILPDGETLIFNEYQAQMIDAWENDRLSITNWPRQVGISTASIAYALHFALFNSHKSVAFVGLKAEHSKYALQAFRKFHAQLPDWMQMKLVTDNKTMIEFENGSIVLPAGGATDRLRGMSLSMLIIDQYDYVKRYTNFIDSYWPIFAAGKHSKVFGVTTDG